MSDRIFQPTDLRQNRGFIDAAKEQGAARLRDTDGVSLLMVREHDFGKIEHDLKALAELSDAARVVLLLDRAFHHDGDPTSLIEASPWPWLRAFDADDLRDFIETMAETIVAGITDREASEMHELLDGWREGARALADPRRLAALTEPIEPARLIEIAPE